MIPHFRMNRIDAITIQFGVVHQNTLGIAGRYHFSAVAICRTIFFMGGIRDEHEINIKSHQAVIGGYFTVIVHIAVVPAESRTGRFLAAAQPGFVNV